MNKNLVFVILILLAAQGFSQNQIIPEKIMYQDASGKIFVNKSLPLYFKISESVEPGSERKLLISKTTPTTTNPVYLSKEGLNTFYSPWAVDTVTKKVVYPKQNVVFEVYADGTAPTTKINNNLTAYDKSDTLYFGANLKVWFTAIDNVSGVEKTYLSINNSAFDEYLHDSLSFEHGNYYTIKYYSTDRTGNYEDVKDVSFMVDTTRPLTNLVVLGNHYDNIVGPGAKVSLKPQDAFSGSAKTYYYIDNQPKRVYTSPINVASLSEGRHVLNYYTQDNVNNVEDVKSYEFYIDKTPPMVIDEIIGDYVFINGKAYTSGRSQIQLSAIDNKAGVKTIYYSLDGNEWNVYENPFFLPTNQNNVSVFYYAEDNVGNKTSFDRNNTSYNKHFASQMDLEPPDVNYSFSQPKIKFFDTLFISNQTKISLNAFDRLSGVKNISYQVDGGQNFDYSNSFSINDHGYHKVSAFCFDQVNNMGNSDFFVMVDTISPEIYTNFSFTPFNVNGKLVYPVGTKLFIAATDANTGVKNITYKINGSSTITYGSYITFSRKGSYNVIITAYDNLNNKSIKTITFRVE